MNKKHTKSTKSQIKEDVRKLTLERLKVTPMDFEISIGGAKTMSRDEMISSVVKGDDMGKKIMDIQLEFLKDMASGKIYQDA